MAPKMKIDSVLEKGSSFINEDSLLIKENLFGVFDGYSSLTKFINKSLETSKKSEGLIASSIAKTIFERGDGSLKDLATRANRAIRDEMIKLGLDYSKKANLFGTSAAVVRINEASFDWVQITDSLIMVITKDNQHKILFSKYDHDEDLLVKWKKLGNLNREEKLHSLLGEIAKAREQQNIEYGYLNGEPQMRNHIRGGTHSLDDVAHIILFTDGLIPPKEDPKNPDDFSEFVTLFLEGGLLSVKNHIRKIQRDDPECRKYPRVKKHDDIAAISLSFH